MIKIVPSGDSIIILNNLNNLKSSTLTDYLEKLELNEIEDIISLKSSVGILFNPHKISSSDFIKKTKNLLTNKNLNNSNKIKTWEIPICYDKDFAIDLNEISTKCKIDVDQVIKNHNNKTYEVDIVGFLPGFLYLGKLDDSLHLPRKNNPRTHIPEGSIGIAGNQTGIYNIESPGGWNIIGRTPLRLFDKLKNPPIKIKQGDKIIFKEITKEEFNNY
tara:strand:- start:1859 stop:2509 length:651 start_codon:yes stop_codon:yes gene_type:complete